MSIQIAGLLVGLAIFAGYLALAYHFSKPGSYEGARHFRQMGIGRGSYRGADPADPETEAPVEASLPTDGAG